MGLFSLSRRQTVPEAPSTVPDLGFKTPTSSTPDVEKDDSFASKEQVDVQYGDRSEITELTPMEALNWNVDGDTSPFPEVQACVSTEDDPSLEVNSQA